MLYTERLERVTKRIMLVRHILQFPASLRCPLHDYFTARVLSNGAQRDVIPHPPLLMHNFLDHSKSIGLHSQLAAVDVNIAPKLQTPAGERRRNGQRKTTLAEIRIQ
jgi:hypothetical protein